MRPGMNAITVVGLAAGTLTTLAFAPQAIKSWRTKTTRDVSLGMFTTMCLGVALWVAYGVLLRDVPLMLANSVTLVLALSILVLKLKHG